VKLTIDAQGELPLPWLRQALLQALTTQRGHALLVHASPGVGALPYVLSLAQSMLCEAPQGDASTGGAPLGLACGRCGSCHLFQTHVHPDLMVILPESLRREHDWLMSGDKTEGEDSKRKPSRQIRIDEVRAMLDWAYKTSARGRGKVVVLHPGEALNAQSANALLKTLEEPPAGTRLLLTAADPAWLLPTVRSRCQRVVLPAPAADVAAQWLQGQGVAQASGQAQVLLAACSGRPLDALALARAGCEAPTWERLPQALRQGRADALAGWPVPKVIDTLQKLCHDALAVALGAAPRFFPATAFVATADPAALIRWANELTRVARHDDHPWNEALLVDALVTNGAHALNATRPGYGKTAAALDTLQP
jgi:DNA polymerase-3 subunit delta'